MSRGLFQRSVQPYMNLPFVFAIWAVQKSMPIEQRDELRGIIQQSLARAEGDYASVGQLHAKRINLTSEESVDYLGGFNFHMGVRERAAIKEFQDLLLEIEKMERV